MPIRVLASDVISRIAAGEVVERPASVVKELVENSLDAGATQITVEVSGGGIQLIKVTDNGTGIPAGDVELAFQRHATSKITSDTDLEIVSTLGFRGEALPSIAAVADVLLVTRHRDDVAGVALRLERGALAGKIKQGAPQGTALTVRDLFRNVPARLKFLKSTSTENGHISHLVTQYCLAFPEVKFDLTIGGRNTIRTSGNGNLRDVLIEIYGVETAKAMLEIAPDVSATGGQFPVISGFVGPSSIARSNRNYLSFFVNRRWIQSRMLSYAVEEAYHGMMMTGKHPIVVLNISISPQEIDVNVHPTKSEIKFRCEHDVFIAAQKAVRNTLIGLAPVPSMKLSIPSPVDPASSFPFPASPATRKAAPTPKFVPEQREVFEPPARLPILRVIGQLQNTYIIAEGPDGVYFVDQHAAHERIVFEKVREQQAQRAVEVQGLLEPMTVEVTARQGELLKSQGEVLAEYGFSLEQFGERAYLLRAVPALLKGEKIMTALTEILDSLGEVQKNEWQERVAQLLACHGAVRAGQSLSFQEMEELIRQLERTAVPRNCPHGRPTMMHLSIARLEGEFGR